MATEQTLPVEGLVDTATQYRCCGCGARAPNKVKSCNCWTMVARAGDRTVWMISAERARNLHLADLIKSRLVDTRPEDQDLVLENEDWLRIVNALELAQL